MSILFEKYRLGNKLEVKNRLFMCPMGFAKDPDGGLSTRAADYYEERAKGGFGIIYPSAHVITEVREPAGTGGANYLTTVGHASRLGYVVDRVHRHGAKFLMQFSPGLGRVSSAHPSTINYASASAVPTFYYPDAMCTPLTVGEIQQMVEDTARSARFAKNVGVDGIELHAYGGYLLDQFISKFWNHRTDEYGGSIENRLRFVFQMRDAIRSVCGDDYLVGIKYTPYHGFEGGRTFEDEGVEIAKLLEKEFDFIHLDTGAYENWHKAVSTSYDPPDCQVFMAERLRAEGITAPLLIQGKLNNPGHPEKVLESGLADLVGLGHQAIADPYWPIKYRHGRYDDIIHCIGCNECLYSSVKTRPRTCALNPRTGFEQQPDSAVAIPEIKRKLLVIGAGPAGMYAATMAANLGHDVELWEKDSKLGGMLNAAGAPSFKYDTALYNKHLQVQLHKSNARVVLGKEATVENVAAYAPDAVFVAAGSGSVVPRIPGVGGENVIGAIEMLAEKIPTGKKVVIIGGGLVGCEAALHLDEQGKDVTIVEMMPALLTTADHCKNVDQAIKHLLKESTIKNELGARVTEILADRVKLIAADGTEKEIECDNVVLAIGFRKNHDLADALEAKGLPVVQLGNYYEAGKIYQAIHSAYHAVRLIEDRIAYV